MRLVAVLLVAAMAGQAASGDADVAKLLSRPDVNKAFVRYASSVSVFAHYVGACEQNYDRAFVDAALAEVLKRRSGRGDSWDRVNDMLTAIWSEAYTDGRSKAGNYNWDLDRCDDLTSGALKDIKMDRGAFDGALQRAAADTSIRPAQRP